MARTVVPLTSPKCDAARYNPEGKNNKLFDGGGLYLLLKPTGGKTWRLKYNKPNGKEDTLVIGEYPAVSLKQARIEREEARAQLARGTDPKEHRREEVIRRKQAELHTFEAVALEWHAMEASRWSPDYASRFKKRLEDNLFPEIGSRPVATLKTRDLIAPLKKIEQRNAHVIAIRMKQAITGIMRYAVQQGLIDANPALDLAGSIVKRKPTHRPALPLERLPELLQRIQGYQGRTLTRLALELSLLVFIRSSELRFARWSEIDLEKGMWTIPGEREPLEGVKHSHRGAKMRTPHLVPLCRQAIAVLEQVQAISGRHELVFPGDHNSRKPLSDGTINRALQRMGYDTKKDVCGHGFRTMACGSLIQSGLWQEDAVERQMSHQERNGVRQAYTHQAEFIQERRLMMQWWADFLDANRILAVSPFDFSNLAQGSNKVVKISSTPRHQAFKS